MPVQSFVVVATCKTAGCGNIIAFGQRGPQVGPIESASNTSSGIFYRCGKCQQIHRYNDKDARMEQVTPGPQLVKG